MQIGKEVTKFTQAGIKESIRTTNVLRNLNFNRKQFKTSFSGSGVNVSLIPTADDFEHHFQIQKKTSSEIEMHAGRWIRTEVDWTNTYGTDITFTTFDIEMPIDGGLTSGEYEDTKTIDMLGYADGDWAVAIRLDDRDAPTHAGRVDL